MYFYFYFLNVICTSILVLELTCDVTDNEEPCQCNIKQRKYRNRPTIKEK